MPRKLAIVTIALWLLLWPLVWILGLGDFTASKAALLFPLGGTYPGEAWMVTPSDDLKAWLFGTGVLYLILAFMAVWRKSIAAAIAFLAFFLISIAICFVRLYSMLHHH